MSLHQLNLQCSKRWRSSYV